MLSWNFRVRGYWETYPGQFLIKFAPLHDVLYMYSLGNICETKYL